MAKKIKTYDGRGSGNSWFDTEDDFSCPNGNRSDVVGYDLDDFGFDVDGDEEQKL